MKEWRLRIPSKTFVLGEYAVLEGGPCLGAATTPYFEFTFSVQQEDSTIDSVFHNESPAGKFFLENKEIFKNINLKFVDPLKGRGGFGASTAQYLALWAFRELHLKKRSREDILKAANIKAMIREYRNFSTRTNGRAPSGADLVMQLAGGFSWIDSTTWEIQKMLWPWTEATGFFVATGNKVATHSHLQDLSDFNPSELFRILQQSRSALKSKDLATWSDSVRNYSKDLGLLGLVALSTSELLNELASWSEIEAAKGCGAMGADVIFCVVKTAEMDSFKTKIKAKGLTLIASMDNLSSGLELLNEEAQPQREFNP